MECCPKFKDNTPTAVEPSSNHHINSENCLDLRFGLNHLDVTTRFGTKEFRMSPIDKDLDFRKMTVKNNSKDT